MRPIRRLFGAVAALAVAASGLVACSSAEDAATEALTGFLTGWSEGDLSAVAFTTPVGEAATSAAVSEQLAALSGELADRQPVLTAGQVSLEPPWPPRSSCGARSRCPAPKIVSLPWKLRLNPRSKAQFPGR